jgi:hypothetical protein
MSATRPRLLVHGRRWRDIQHPDDYPLPNDFACVHACRAPAECSSFSLHAASCRLCKGVATIIACLPPDGKHGARSHGPMSQRDAPHGAYRMTCISRSLADRNLQMAHVQRENRERVDGPRVRLRLRKPLRALCETDCAKPVMRPPSRK